MAVTVGASRLDLGALRRLPADSRPLVRPGTVPAGMVHLGLGAFHRAHQAVYTEAAVGVAGGTGASSGSRRATPRWWRP